jgi:hypothetical protein
MNKSLYIFIVALFYILLLEETFYIGEQKTFIYLNLLFISYSFMI